MAVKLDRILREFENAERELQAQIKQATDPMQREQLEFAFANLKELRMKTAAHCGGEFFPVSSTTTSQPKGSPPKPTGKKS
jgi:hypothetical protein